MQRSLETLKAEILEKVREYTTLQLKSQPRRSTVPYAGRVYDSSEVENAVDASLDFWLTTGKYTDAFEKRFAEFLGVKYALFTNSGSSANLLAIAALTSPLLNERRLKKGDEVITVAAGFPTTVTPILQFGAIPVFIDISLPTYNLDISLLEDARTSKTRALIVAHTLGNPFDLSAVKNFCKKHDLFLIEDNCDALGSMYGGKLTGTFGDIATSSFYPAHHMTTGEGGAVYTNDPLLKRILLSLRDWGRDCWCPSGKDNTCGKRFDWEIGNLPPGYDHKYIYSHLGFNLKATEMQAAIGLAQIKKLPSFLESRRRNWNFLKNAFADLDDVFILPEPTAESDPSWFGFALTVRPSPSNKVARNSIVRYLEENGVQTRMLFAGNLLKQPAFQFLEKDKDYRVSGDLKVTEQIMNDTFWLGVYPGLTQSQIEFVVDRVRESVRLSGRM